MLDSINAEQGLYVLRHEGGYTCLGFDNALVKAEQVHAWLTENGVTGVPKPNPDLRGTEAGYAEYEAVMAAGQAFNARTGRRCNAELIPALVGLEGKRVEAVDQAGDRHQFYVGKSMGWFPIHLQIARKGDRGGLPVLDGMYTSFRVVK